MSAQELNNETFPGIEAVNGFYTAYYMQEYFPRGRRQRHRTMEGSAGRGTPRITG